MFLHFLLDGEASGSSAAGVGGCTTQQWIIYIVLFALLIAFFVWSTISSKKRQKAEKEKLDALKIGDRVKTIGGVCGFVVDINDEENTFTLETGYGDSKSYVKFDKGAIYQVGANGTEAQLTAGSPATETETDEREKENNENTATESSESTVIESETTEPEKEQKKKKAKKEHRDEEPF